MGKKHKPEPDHRAKLAWAWKHLEALDKSIDGFLKSDAYFATEEYNPENRGYIGRIYVKRDLLPEWSLMVGDIVHNLRSSLDSLAYALSLKHSGLPSEDEARSIQFLLVDTKGEFNDPRRRRYIKRMSPEAQAVVERLQPFNTKPDGFKHQLSVLRDISNVDKHRHILLTRAAAESSKIALSGPGIPPGTEVQGIAGPFENGAVIARWRFDQGPVAEVKMRMHVAVAIEFADGPATGGALVPFLKVAHNMIRDDYFPPLEALL